MRKLSEHLLRLYVFTIPWDGLPIPGMWTATRTVGLVLVGATLATVITNARLRRPDSLFTLAAVFTLSGAATLLWTVSPGATFQAVWTYAQLLGSAWVIREIIRTPEQVRPLLMAFCLGMFVPVGSLLYNYFMGISLTGVDRYSAVGWNADGLGMLLAVGIPITWYLFQNGSGPSRLIPLILLAFAPTGILLTGARGPFLAGLAGLAIVPLTLARLTTLRTLRVVAAAAVIVVMLVPFVPQSSWERMATIPSEIFGSGSLTGRREIWRAGLSAFPENPVLGVGVGAFGSVLASQRTTRFGSEMHSHNTFIGLLVEQGAVGMVFFLALLSACAAIIYRLPPPERTLWSVVMLVWLVGTMSLSLERWKVTWFILGILAARHGADWLVGSGVERAQVAPAFVPPATAVPVLRHSVRAPGGTRAFTTGR